MTLPLSTEPPKHRYSRARCKEAAIIAENLAAEYVRDEFSRDYWRGVKREWEARWERGYD